MLGNGCELGACGSADNSPTACTDPNLSKRVLHRTKQTKLSPLSELRPSPIILLVVMMRSSSALTETTPSASSGILADHILSR
jgi:hypothetical protein